MAGTQVTRFLSDALDDVEDALRVVLRARQVDWRSPAAERYREALDEVAVRLRLTCGGISRAAAAVAALDAAVAASPWRSPAIAPGTVWL